MVATIWLSSLHTDNQRHIPVDLVYPEILVTSYIGTQQRAVVGQPDDLTPPSVTHELLPL